MGNFFFTLPFWTSVSWSVIGGTLSHGIIIVMRLKYPVCLRVCPGKFPHLSTLVLRRPMFPIVGISPWTVFWLPPVSNSGLKAVKWILILEPALGKHFISSFKTQNSWNLSVSILSFTLPTIGTGAFDSKHIKECIAKLLYNCSQMHASFQLNGTVLKKKKNAFYSLAPVQ